MIGTRTLVSAPTCSTVSSAASRAVVSTCPIVGADSFLDPDFRPVLTSAAAAGFAFGSAGAVLVGAVRPGPPDRDVPLVTVKPFERWPPAATPSRQDGSGTCQLIII